jgi:hypothetical protein
LGGFKYEKKCKKKKRFFSEKEALLPPVRSKTGRGVSNLLEKEATLFVPKFQQFQLMS